MCFCCCLPSILVIFGRPSRAGNASLHLPSPFRQRIPTPLEMVENGFEQRRGFSISGNCAAGRGDAMGGEETTGQILRLGLRNKASSFFSPVGQGGRPGFFMVLTVGSPRRREEDSFVEIGC